MLQAARFAGDEKQLLATAGQLWEDFSGAMVRSSPASRESLRRSTRQRLVAFLDSQAQHLWAAGYVFRVRRRLEGGRPEVTLKFRHPDRYVAESPSDEEPAHTCGDQIRGRRQSPVHLAVRLLDQGPRRQEGRAAHARCRVGSCSRISRSGSVRLTAVSPSCRSTASRFEKLVLTGPILTIGAKPRVEAECALIVWYEHGHTASPPVAVEFSFRYGNPGGQYSGKAASRAFNVFEVLQRDLGDWVDPNPTTKTALVFG